VQQTALGRIHCQSTIWYPKIIQALQTAYDADVATKKLIEGSKEENVVTTIPYQQFFVAASGTTIGAIFYRPHSQHCQSQRYRLALDQLYHLLKQFFFPRRG